MKLPFCDFHIVAFLAEFEASPKPLDLALSAYFRAHPSLGASDRRTIGETLFGMARWKSLVDYFCSSPEPRLRLYCYQSLDLAKCTQDPSIPESVRLGMPDFLYGRLVATYGREKGVALCRTLNTQAPTTIRANLLKTTRDALLETLAKHFAVSPCTQAPSGIQLAKREPLFSLPEFKEGLFEMQDEGSQLLAALVRAKPGEHVLDYCSGSGGKTLAFAPAMQGKGQIYLHDTRLTALEEARKRLRRAGIQHAQFLPPDHSHLRSLRGKMDWVLADVPCSGSGTLRRNPDAKWKIDAPFLAELIAKQRAIAAAAVEFVKPGGHFVYATCSLLPEENGEQVAHFLSAHPLQLVGTPSLFEPQEGGMDGFYAAVFQKNQTV